MEFQVLNAMLLMDIIGILHHLTFFSKTIKILSSIPNDSLKKYNFSMVLMINDVDIVIKSTSAHSCKN